MDRLTRWRKSPNYIGEDYSDYYIIAVRSRDSDAVEASNFEAALKRLGGENPPHVIITRARHWAVGWVETLLLRQDAPKYLLEEAEKMTEELEEYPVLDEGLWSEYASQLEEPED